MRRWNHRLARLVVLGTLATGCDESFVDPVNKNALWVRSSYPAAGTYLDRADPVSVSITFNRAISQLNEIKTTLVPEAEAGDLMLSPSGRNLTWHDIVPDPVSPIQCFLVDSEFMPAPFVLYWRANQDAQVGSSTGTIYSHDPARPASAAVAFAMSVNSGFNPLDLRTFVLAKPTSMAVAGGAATQAGVSIPLLRGVGEFLIIAIADTNGDLIYDPTEDWSGVPTDRDGTPISIVPGELGFEIELSAP